MVHLNLNSQQNNETIKCFLGLKRTDIVFIDGVSAKVDRFAKYVH